MAGARKNNEATERLGEELEAQLGIVRAVKGMDAGRRTRVLLAMSYILQADELVPGIFEAVGRGLKTKEKEEEKRK